MQILKTLLNMLGKQKLIDLALSILWKALGRMFTDALYYVKEAEAHKDWSADDKLQYVRKSLTLYYSDKSNWKWLINLCIELAVSQLPDSKSATGALKSAAIVKLGG
jgi:hypothetical protein